MPNLKKDYTGQVVGIRTVLKFSKFTTNHNDPLWLVRCACGHEFESLTQDLKRRFCRKCRNKDHRKKPFESLYNTFVKRASKRFVVDITYEQFVEFTKVLVCHYCGADIFWSRYQSKFKGVRKGQPYNLDRKNNDDHYTVGNVVVCCARCNMSRNKYFTYEEWKEIGQVIRSWRAKENV